MNTEQLVKALNERGADITVAQYRKLCVAMTRKQPCREKGVIERTKTTATGEVVHRREAIIEHPYDESEVRLVKEIRSAHDTHLNRCACGNRWFEDPADELDGLVEA